MNRPTETLTAIVNSIVAAVIGILVIYHPEWAENLGKATPYIVLLLAWIATAVTYFVARRLRNPDSPLVSAPDGSVTTVPALLEPGTARGGEQDA